MIVLIKQLIHKTFGLKKDQKTVFKRKETFLELRVCRVLSKVHRCSLYNRFRDRKHLKIKNQCLFFLTHLLKNCFKQLKDYKNI